jgi:hypothetical protein
VISISVEAVIGLSQLVIELPNLNGTATAEDISSIKITIWVMMVVKLFSLHPVNNYDITCHCSTSKGKAEQEESQEKTLNRKDCTLFHLKFLSLPRSEATHMDLKIWVFLSLLYHSLFFKQLS